MKTCYAWATGRIDIYNDASTGAVLFIKKQVGFLAINFMDNEHTLFIFDTLKHASRARERAKEQGIVCGTYIMRCEWEGDTITVYEPVMGERDVTNAKKYM